MYFDKQTQRFLSVYRRYLFHLRKTSHTKFIDRVVVHQLTILNICRYTAPVAIKMFLIDFFQSATHQNPYLYNDMTLTVYSRCKDNVNTLKTTLHPTNTHGLAILWRAIVTYNLQWGTPSSKLNTPILWNIITFSLF